MFYLKDADSTELLNFEKSMIQLNKIELLCTLHKFYKNKIKIRA